jgi:hypothetical protein
MIHTVTSNSDQQESTILEIDSTTARMTVKLRIQNQQPQSILNAKLNTLFSLNFTKYDLLNNRMFWGFVVHLQPVHSGRVQSQACNIRNRRQGSGWRASNSAQRLV